MTLTLRLEEATVVVTVGGQEITLRAPASEISTAQPDGNGRRSAHTRFEFRGSYNDAIDLGNLESALQSIEDAFGPVLDFARDATGAPTERLKDKWETFRSQFQQVPVLSSITQTVLQTNVRITALVLDLQFVKPSANEAATVEGFLHVGLMFTPEPASAPRFIVVQVKRFGATFSVKVKGSAEHFNWPPS